MRIVSIALALVALLVLVALGSAGGGWGGGPAENGVPRPLVNVAYTVGILFLVAMAAVAIWAFMGPRAGVRVERPRGNGIVGFALFTIVLLFWYTYVERNPLRERESQVDPQGIATGVRPGDAEGFAAAPGPEFQWWIAAGAVLALAAVILYERRRRDERRPATAAEDLDAVLTEALAELEAELDADPRRAVIQAYARMERVLDAHGHGRRPHEAPLEYLARILAELDVRATSAHALTELFERAKFSRHEIDAAMRAEAVASLEAVRDDLRAAA